MRSLLARLLAMLPVISLVYELGAEVYRIRDFRQLEYLVEEKVLPGDIIEIPPGHHYFEYDRISIQRSGAPDKPIIIRGVMENGRRPVIDAIRVNIHRSVFVLPQDVHDIVIENLEICNAAGRRYPDRIPKYGVNSSAVYFEGSKNITVRNCDFHHNEDGLFATHEADCILIENSAIHHNGTEFKGRHNRTHNFYFCAKRQIVRNCYIHHPTEGENFKSRGDNTILAYNWIDEEAIYSTAVDSGGSKNTLWVGNVIMKRTNLGHGQGRLLGLGDGTGVASGKLLVLNNTFITFFPRDFYLYTHKSSTGDVMLIGNVFAGPGEVLLEKNGIGEVSGSHNWIRSGLGGLPEVFKNTLSGEDPGFVNAEDYDFRPKEGSPLVDSGISRAELEDSVRAVTENSRTAFETRPSPIWLEAVKNIEESIPGYSPVRKGYGFQKRTDDGRLDIGAYER